MNNTGLINIVQARQSINTSATSNGEPIVSLYLVLLNYRPIYRIKDGLKEYLYVDIYNPKGVCYFLSVKSTRVLEPVGILDDLLEIQSPITNFMNDLSVLSKNPMEPGDTEKEETICFTSKSSIIEYRRMNAELKALLFSTREFTQFELAALRKTNANRVGCYLFGSHMRLKDRVVPRDEWIQACYRTYMLYQNIELGEYYYTNQKKPGSDWFFEMNRITVLDEFIPLAYKFLDIQNPLLDLRDFLRQSKIFSEAVEAKPLSVVSTSSHAPPSADAQTYGLYTTRIEVSELFSMGCGKWPTAELLAAGRIPIKLSRKYMDFYRPKYFWTVLYTQLIEALELDELFCLAELNDQVYVRHVPETWTTEDGAIDEFDSVGFRGWMFNSLYLKESNKSNSDIKDHKASLLTALLIEYLTAVYRAAPAAKIWQRTGNTANLKEDILVVE